MPTWKKHNPQHKSFNCGFYWHYRKTGIYLAVYDLLGNVTSGGKNSFFSSIEKVATYFDANYETVRRVIKQLVKEGWLKRDAVDARKYWWVSHDDWAKANPGKCCTRAVLIWEAETDPLVGKIYAILDGKIRLYENHVIAIRKLAADEEILRLLRLAANDAKARKANGEWDNTSPKDCFWKVFRNLRAQAKIRQQQLPARNAPRPEAKANQNQQDGRK